MPKKETPTEMMVSMAIADAYGAGREYATPRATRKSNDLRTYRQHHKWKELKPGHYTDDTQMMIALAELLIEFWELGWREITTLDWANKVVDVFKRDPRAGYAGGFYQLLQEVKNGTELVQRLLPHSNKNGGAMRAAPCGFLPNSREVVDCAMWQASLTHASYEGMMAAAASALLVYGCRTGCPKEDLSYLLKEYIPSYDWSEPWEGRVLAPGFQAVHAALTAIGRGATLSNVLWESVNFTGDVDTVAAISVAAASMHPDIPNNFHPDLLDGLEDGPYGRRFLIGLDKSLKGLFLDPLPVDKEVKDPSTEPDDTQGVLAMFEDD